MTNSDRDPTRNGGSADSGTDLVFASEHLREIRNSYDSLIIRSYVWARFVIIHIDILDLLDRLLPKQGRILDMGCGFGLFSLFLAMRSPERMIHGVDISGRRIEAARKAANRLGLDNVEFECADVRDYAVQGEWDGVFTLDLLHHVPPGSRLDFLRAARAHLSPEGVLVIKDITTEPWHKMMFTWFLDLAIAGPCRVWYQHHDDQAEELQRLGFETQFRRLSDRLPYPHVVFRCQANRDFGQ
jgi:2-polyprenyl-3-methyl-5-hydroxy-6-metoxy-1,4-benzoquinol methylase